MDSKEQLSIAINKLQVARLKSKELEEIRKDITKEINEARKAIADLLNGQGSYDNMLKLYTFFGFEDTEKKIRENITKVPQQMAFDFLFNYLVGELEEGIIPSLFVEYTKEEPKEENNP